MDILLREECILQRFWPLIPYRDALVANLLRMGCERRSDALACSDAALMAAGLPETEMVGLFRAFLVMYDPRPQKMREIASVSGTPEESAAFRALYLLPGVKSTRARLYLRAGFGTLEAIAAATPEGLISACTLAIARDSLPMKPPQPKEVRTHIAVARAFTAPSEEVP